jgi:2-oxoisovalerate dehydrogenase E2 component (dihydrolipoyl transacylase)
MAISTLFSITARHKAIAQRGAAWGDETVPVIGLRRRIADNMAAAKRHIPHFSYVEEVEVTALEEIRAQLNSAGGDRPRLTLLPLLITAMCRALPLWPMLNARYDDEAGTVTRHGRVHMGLATQTPAGLMVPVIRDAQDMNLWQLSSAITRLAGAARDGTIRREELGGSTITITSLGPLAGWPAPRSSTGPRSPFWPPTASWSAPSSSRAATASVAPA